MSLSTGSPSSEAGRFSFGSLLQAEVPPTSEISLPAPPPPTPIISIQAQPGVLNVTHGNASLSHVHDGCLTKARLSLTRPSWLRVADLLAFIVQVRQRNLPEARGAVQNVSAELYIMTSSSSSWCVSSAFHLTCGDFFLCPFVAFLSPDDDDDSKATTQPLLKKGRRSSSFPHNIPHLSLFSYFSLIVFFFTCVLLSSRLLSPGFFGIYSGVFLASLEITQVFALLLTVFYLSSVWSSAVCGRAFDSVRLCSRYFVFHFPQKCPECLLGYCFSLEVKVICCFLFQDETALLLSRLHFLSMSLLCSLNSVCPATKTFIIQSCMLEAAHWHSSVASKAHDHIPLVQNILNQSQYFKERPRTIIQIPNTTAVTCFASLIGCMAVQWRPEAVSTASIVSKPEDLLYVSKIKRMKKAGQAHCSVLYLSTWVDALNLHF